LSYIRQVFVTIESCRKFRRNLVPPEQQEQQRSHQQQQQPASAELAVELGSYGSDTKAIYPCDNTVYYMKQMNA